MTRAPRLSVAQRRVLERVANHARGVVLGGTDAKRRAGAALIQAGLLESRGFVVVATDAGRAALAAEE